MFEEHTNYKEMLKLLNCNTFCKIFKSFSKSLKINYEMISFNFQTYL